MFWHGSCGKVLSVPRVQWSSCYAVIGRGGLPTLVEHLRFMVPWTIWSKGLSFLGCVLGLGCTCLYQTPHSHCYVEFWALGPLVFHYSTGVGLSLTQPTLESPRVTVGERKRL